MLSQSSYQSQSISSGSPSRPVPKSPWRRVYCQGVSDWPPTVHARQLHLVIIGALGCPCSSQVLAALQQPHSLACVAQCAGSLHRLTGLIALLRPVTCSLEFGPPTQLRLLSPSQLLDPSGRLDLACYNNNHVIGSAGRLAAAAGYRPR